MFFADYFLCSCRYHNSLRGQLGRHILALEASVSLNVIRNTTSSCPTMKLFCDRNAGLNRLLSSRRGTKSSLLRKAATNLRSQC
ncbi:hypothetical protein BO1005MUT1_180143 [Hyphomicrobiales bacterium]|nr:hypothetical protein BO1005MUT1_180143 [Hyphomicrobiales bacterium]